MNSRVWMRWGWALFGLGTATIASACDGDTTTPGDAENAGGGGEPSSSAGQAGESAAGRDDGGAGKETSAGGQSGAGAGTGSFAEGGTSAGMSGSPPMSEAGAGGHGGAGDDPIACHSGWGEPYSCGPGTYCRRRGNDHFIQRPPCSVPYSQAELEFEEYTCPCVEIPEECDDSDVRPTCGDDGVVYANVCEMRRQRHDYPALWEDVHCPASHGDDWFLCDGIYCRTGVEICERQEEPDDGSTVEFRCVEDPCASGGGCDCVYPQGGAGGAGGDGNVPAECCEEPRAGAVRVTWRLSVECPER